ncbi:MAG: cyclically-permuted mutarotase family protein [Clostridium sp.]|nr:cyclically-permuted mutarotase family protein [Clostridium sp.]
MKRRIIQFLCLMLVLGCTQGAWSRSHDESVVRDNKYNRVTYRSLCQLTVGGDQGVSASFAGRHGGALLVAGGCNFPGIPASEGGKKVYYDKVFRLDDPLAETSRWQEVGRLPHPTAYGVSVTVPEGVVCIGGTDGLRSLSDVYLLALDGETADVHPLPPLPIPLDNMGGAYGDGYIYVAGGSSGGTPSRAAFRLSYPGGKEWQRLPDMPDGNRLQPAAVVQNGSDGYCFYVMGGYCNPVDNMPGIVHVDGVVYNPRTNDWKTTAHIAPQGQLMTLVGATGIPSGCAHVVFIGGVNADVFAAAINRPFRRARAESNNDSLRLALIDEEIASYMYHPVEWYRFNEELVVYHTVTDTWVTESRSALLARAGHMVVPFDDEWIVVNGESKPGIRSADVTAVKMTVRTEFGWLNWVVLISYLVGMLALGFYFMRREGDSDDFFKGGGRIPWWAAGISIYATMLSAITYMAYPAKAYVTDWTYYPMLITILLVSYPVVRYYLPFFRRLNVTSAYEYLESRFNATTRLMASALFIIFMVARMALVLYLPSLALTAVTGIDIYICIILMGLITIAYCTMGGVEAVVWGDVVQGFILVGGALLAAAYLIWGTEGGAGSFFNIAYTDDKFRLFNWSLDYRSATFWVVIVGGMANNLISYTSDQTVIQRYLTTKDEDSARRSIMLNGVMSVFVSIIFFVIGAGLYTFFKTHPAELDYTMQKSDIIFPFFMMSQLPSGVAGLLIAAIFAATMSTISSNINSVATAFSIDFYKRWRPAATDRHMLDVARKACVLSGVTGMGIALLMATWEILSLLDFFQEILGLLSSGLGGLFLIGIFFPRIGGRSALVGFSSGVLAVFAVKYFTATSFLLYGFIGMVVSVAVAWLCSFLFHEEVHRKGLTWDTLADEES